MHHFPYILLRSPQQSLRQALNFNQDTTPIFQEGLYLSSPDYWQEFKKRDQLQGKDKDKLEKSFAKYWLRSCTRCTPYGTFAGSTLASVSGQDTSLVLNGSGQHVRSMRLDMNYMAEIIKALIQVPVIQEQLLFYTNNSLYELPDGFRYAEYTIVNNARSYQLTSVLKTDYLVQVLEKARTGARLAGLAQFVSEQEEVSAEEAQSYIMTLCESQLLQSALEPCVTGKEPLDQLIDQLEELQEVEGITSKLKQIQDLIRNPQEGVTYYQKIEDELRSLGVTLEIPKNTLQTDLFLSVQQNTVNEELVSAIISQVEDLKQLARSSRNAELDDFKSKFQSRYEDSEVPLPIVLDADLGLGYAGVNDELSGGGAWVDDLAVMRRGGPATGPEFDYILQFTLKKYHDWLKHKKDVIEIEAAELDGFKKHTENFVFPNSMYLMGSLLKQDGKLDKDRFRFDLSGFGGPSAGNLLGRFTHGDAALCDITKTILKAEEELHPDAIYAEIVHLPQARIGNILLRPVLRSYEIPYVGKSGIDMDHQITVDDLMVSVQNNEIVLRSKKHNKRIFPRLTTAHNFVTRSLPVYKFLCDLQNQGIAYPNVWDWGHLAALKHLPRVIYKDLILHKAKWKFEESDIKDLPENKEAYTAFFTALRDQWQLPQQVVYAEGDNELLIDFENERCLDLLVYYIKRNKKVTLEEFLFTDENCVVTDTHQQPYTNEVIIPLFEKIRETTDNKAAENTGNQVSKGASGRVPRKIVRRNFSLYSEWSYFKIYCGTKTAEKVLKETILPFAEAGLEKKLFEHFFFIRYRDEASHFRIRFYNSDPDRQLAVQKELMTAVQPLLDSGTLHKVVADTYNRELERYGDDLIEEAEVLFFNDSLAVLRFINLLEEDENDQYRMLFGMRGIDMLLDDFRLTSEQKASLLKGLQSGFLKEFGGHTYLQKQLNDKYRKHQKFITGHMNPALDEAHEIEEATGIFRTRSEMNAPVVERILGEIEKLEDIQHLFNLLSSYIHMYMNRLFIAQQRKYELLVYHFLERYYTSQIAKTKKEKKNGVSLLQTA
jgi:thiopeptide-type bacteriocin biosynthesis protein